MDIVLIVLIVTTLGSTFMLMMKLCFASKCQKVKLCYGLLEVRRDTENELPSISMDNEEKNVT